MSLVAALALALTAPPDLVAFLPRASVRGEVVRLGDVADLSALPEPLRARAGTTPVARVGEGPQTLSTRRLAARARAAMPGLSPWLAAEADGVVEVVSAPVETPAPVPNPVAVAPVSPISPGDVLTLRVTVGPVTVEREVRALQAGAPGQPVFVRTDDGVVLRALVPEGL